MDKLTQQRARTLLVQRKYDELLDLCEQDRRFWKTLRMDLYEIDEAIRWPAIEAIAKLMKRWWQSGRQEVVREYIRNLMWSLSDESGGNGWNAPQTIAEIIIAIPQLLEPYGSMMLVRAMEESLLIKSGLWGMGRMGKRIKGAVESSSEGVLAVFKIDDPETLGLAAWAVGEVGFVPALPFLEMLKDRKDPVPIYIDGSFHEKSMGWWAREAINKITQ